MCDIVRRMREAISIPVFCKMRILPAVADTMELALRLQDAGCSLLCVHGRERGDHRTKNRRKGPADMCVVKKVKQALRIKVICNGNVRSSASDV